MKTTKLIEAVVTLNAIQPTTKLERKKKRRINNNK